MKTLAIFGDSYARKDGSDINEKSWPEFLIGYDITNFGDAGTDLWFSYNLFLKNYQQFDNIIFLVTSPHRLTLFNPNVKIYPNQNYTTASIKLESATGVEKEQYKLIVDYYNLIHNNEKEEKLHQLMINSIKQLRTDAIVYPCFNNTWSNEIPLYSITKFEDKLLGLDKDTRNNFYRNKIRDSRACHMTEANNKVVAELFLSRLNGTRLPLGQLVNPVNDLNYYYQSSWH